MLTGERLAPYQALAGDASRRSLYREGEVGREQGRAFLVNRGQILRITAKDGPQVADVNVFSAADPREMFWSGRTRILEAAHLSVGHQLWSTPPQMRPLMTVIADSVDHRPLAHNVRSHDLIFSRCNQGYYELLFGEKDHRNCQDNLAEAIRSFGLPATSVHDAFNVFMLTGIDENDRLLYLGTDCRRGDFVELFAEIDCIVAVSACPSMKFYGMENLPLGVGIFNTT